MIDIEDLDVHYELRGGTLARLMGRDTGTVRAVDGVNLSLRRGEVLGLVGESGSGKTTLGRALLGLVRATKGSIRYHRDSGVVDIAQANNRQLRKLRTHLQMVFQDPHASLNPSMDIETAVGHPLKIHKLASGRSCGAGSPRRWNGWGSHRPSSSCRSTPPTCPEGRSSVR